MKAAAGNVHVQGKLHLMKIKACHKMREMLQFLSFIALTQTKDT